MNTRIIPPITHPLGQHWRQPKISEITIKADNAYMSLLAFKQLAEYSQSYPTGSYVGKMWKRKKDDTNYYLVWIVASGDGLKYEYATIIIE